MSDDVIELLSSGDEAEPRAAAAAARKRRRGNRDVDAAGGGGAASSPVFLDDSDDDDEGRTARDMDDSIEVVEVHPANNAATSAAAARGAPAAAVAAAAAAAPLDYGNDSDGSSILEVISPARPPANAKSTGEEDEGDDSKRPANTPLSRITDIFPDICRNHAEELLRRSGLNPTRIHATDMTPAEENMVTIALSNIVEEGQSYPKQQNLNGNATMGGGFVVTGAKRKAAYLHDYSSTSSFTPSDDYKGEVINRLMEAFCFLSREGVKRHLELSKGRYSVCYSRIIDALVGREGFVFGNAKKKGGAAAGGGSDLDPIGEEKLHKRLRAVRAGRCALTQEEIGRLRIPAPNGFTATLRRSRRNYQPAAATDKVLLDEIRYCSEKLDEQAKIVATAAKRQRIHDESEKAGTTLECQCCYGDYAFDEFVACRQEGHLFCMDCVRRYAEERVFGLGDLGGKKSADDGGGNAVDENDLLCMHPDGCRSKFHYELLKKALPSKVLEKYDELQASRALEIAGIEGLCKCPKCDYQAVLSPSEMVFYCPVEGCGFESCKLCGEPSHVPLKCEEVEKQNETDGRKKVEEAMTEARIRTCPKPGCGKRFYKVDGCNKMTCACQTWSCYVCRAMIPKNVGYKHFCQKPHCKHESCGGCPLYSNAAEDDLRAAKEAGVKAAKQVRQETATSEGGKEVNVDVDALLKNAGGPAANANQRGPRPPGGYGVYAPLPRPPGAYVPLPPPQIPPMPVIVPPAAMNYPQMMNFPVPNPIPAVPPIPQNIQFPAPPVYGPPPGYAGNRRRRRRGRR